jgi:hypothetical protein
MQIEEQLVDTILVAWTFVKLSIGHPNDWIGGLNGDTPFGGWQKTFSLGICVHHKLVPSLYECFYNILTIFSTFNVDIIIDMMLKWHCNNISWNDIDIILKYLTSYQY